MKSILKSKTFWVNAASAIAWFSAQSFVANNPKLTTAAGIAAAVVNIALRFVTSEAVKLG